MADPGDNQLPVAMPNLEQISTNEFDDLLNETQHDMTDFTDPDDDDENNINHDQIPKATPNMLQIATKEFDGILDEIEQEQKEREHNSEVQKLTFSKMPHPQQQDTVSWSRGQWCLVDVARLDPSHGSLPGKQRRELYESITQRFRIHNDGSLSGAVTDPAFACRSYEIPAWYKWAVFVWFNLLIPAYFVPIPLLLYTAYRLYCGAQWMWLLFTILLGLLLELSPVSLWRGYLDSPLLCCHYNYFSFRFVYHSSTKDYVSNQLLGKAGHPPLTLLAVPHAIVPLAVNLMPPIAAHTLNKPLIGCMADVLRYLPIVRHLFLWQGAISAGKQSIVGALRLGHNIGLIADGIAGMFVKAEDAEVILLKHRKGIAKLSLENGTGVIPAYGFGSTSLYTLYVDPYGIMQRVSRRLKMSLVAFAGKYWTFAPARTPLYFVMGPVINNPNNGVRIEKPTQQQIDEFHEVILTHLKMLFDSHKSFFGWKHKQIVFM